MPKPNAKNDQPTVNTGSSENSTFHEHDIFNDFVFLLYSRIGCPWRGPIHEAPEHETNCSHPKKSGADVMLALQQYDDAHSEERKLFSTLIDLLSYEKIIFNGKKTRWNPSCKLLVCNVQFYFQICK
jgi:hypothetical protein